jgi:hypothetical protein
MSELYSGEGPEAQFETDLKIIVIKAIGFEHYYKEDDIKTSES